MKLISRVHRTNILEMIASIGVRVLEHGLGKSSIIDLTGEVCSKSECAAIRSHVEEPMWPKSQICRYNLR